MGAREWFRPTTRLGRVACWIGLAFVVWFALNQTIMGFRQQAPDLLPRALLIAQGLVGLGMGALAGIVALVAVLRAHERSPIVFVAMLPLLFVVFFLAGELLFPH